MQEGESGLPPAGWYPDAIDPAAHRWWDGRAWTTHVSRPAVAPVATAAPIQTALPAEQYTAVAILERPADISSREYARRAAGYEPRASESYSSDSAMYTDARIVQYGSAQTLSGWLFAVSPVWYGGVNVLVSLAFPFVDRTALAVPSLIAIIALYWGLARTDGKRLQDRGYRPTSTGWVLFPLVYFILRTVRTGARGAPMLATYVLVQVIIIVAAIAVVMAGVQQLQLQQATDAASQMTPYTQADESPADSTQVLSAADRAYLLTPDGMVSGVQYLFPDTDVTVQQCSPFPSSQQGATTHCLALFEGGRYDLTLELTPQYADIAFDVIDIVSLDGGTETPTLES